MNKSKPLESLIKPPEGGKREEIIREAYPVFYKEGFHAAGIERLLERTGISKRTLYKHFDSKEDLIQATILYYSDQQTQRIQTHLKKYQDQPPMDRALSIFDWLASLTEDGHAFGCFAMNAKVEYTQKNAGIESTCDIHFSRLEKLFVDLCHDCGVKHPKKTASQLQTLFRGAILTAQLTRDVGEVKNAKAVAKLILDNAKP